jgi:probable addiction module antidote protein
MKDAIPFELSEYLDSEATMQAYLNHVLVEGDQDELNRALGYIAKARGMTQVASESGLGRESLYKAIKQGSKPQFATIKKIANALGMNMQFVMRKSVGKTAAKKGYKGVKMDTRNISKGKVAYSAKFGKASKTATSKAQRA